MAKKTENITLTLAQTVADAIISAIKPLAEFDAGNKFIAPIMQENEDPAAFLARFTSEMSAHKTENDGKALAFRSAINEALSPCLAMIPSAPSVKANAGNRSTYSAEIRGQVYDMLSTSPRPSANEIAKATGVNVNTVILWRGKWSFREGLTPLPRNVAIGESAVSSV